MPLLSFLFRNRDRAAQLARYGDHLSEGLREVAQQLAGEVGGLMARGRPQEEESPYKDGTFKAPPRPIAEVDDSSPYRD